MVGQMRRRKNAKNDYRSKRSNLKALITVGKTLALLSYKQWFKFLQC